MNTLIPRYALEMANAEENTRIGLEMGSTREKNDGVLYFQYVTTV